MDRLSKGRRGSKKALSLHPLGFEEAVADIMKVKPQGTSYRVTFRCPNPKCGYEEILTVDAKTKTGALRAGGPKCPAHEEPMEGIRAEAISK